MLAATSTTRKNQEIIRGSDLRRRYGRDTDFPELNIYGREHYVSQLTTAQARVAALPEYVAPAPVTDPEEPTEVPIAVSGYYPLYESEDAANAAGDGTSHTHVFNSTTYYMPNGVTFYHGNYGTNSY